jgi:hypothetical protein
MLRPDDITTHPEAMKKLFDEMENVVEHILERTKLEEREKLRETIRIRKVEPTPSDALTIVVDGGYNPIQLGTLEVLPSIAVACRFKGYNEVSEARALATIVPIEIYGRPAEKCRSLINDRLILQLAKEELKEDPDFLIIDGVFPPFSCVPMTAPHKDPPEVFEEFEKFLEAANEFLTQARHHKKLVGFVKRPRGTGFQKYILGREVRGSDSSLFGRLLAKGEMVEPYSLAYRDYLRKWLPEYRFYASYARFGMKGANRIEIPEWSLPYVEEMVGYFLAYATPGGWPYQIVKADYYAKISPATKDRIYLKFLNELRKKVEELGEDAFHYTLSQGEFCTLKIRGEEFEA